MFLRYELDSETIMESASSVRKEIQQKCHHHHDYGRMLKSIAQPVLISIYLHKAKVEQ